MAVQMFAEFEVSAVVKAQAFPDGVAALCRGIEGADPGAVAREELTINVNQEVAVPFVELL